LGQKKMPRGEKDAKKGFGKRKKKGLKAIGTLLEKREGNSNREHVRGLTSVRQRRGRELVGRNKNREDEPPLNDYTGDIAIRTTKKAGRRESFNACRKAEL